jgi:dynein regulatory complex subunit 2
MIQTITDEEHSKL